MESSDPSVASFVQIKRAIWMLESHSATIEIIWETTTMVSQTPPLSYLATNSFFVASRNRQLASKQGAQVSDAHSHSYRFKKLMRMRVQARLHSR